MFDDFRECTVWKASRRRLAGSMVVAVALYAALGVALVGASVSVPTPVAVAMERVAFFRPPAAEDLDCPAPPKPLPPTMCPLRRRKLRLPQRDVRLPDQGEPQLNVEGSGAAPANAPQVATPAPPAPPATPSPLVRPRDAPGNRYARLKYPGSAMRRGIAGTIVVEFEVMEDGRVRDVRILQGPIEFHQSVLQAVRAWTFEPARRAGQPVRYRMLRRVVFKLDDA
jgi:periplasmic protein TonB